MLAAAAVATLGAVWSWQGAPPPGYKKVQRYWRSLYGAVTPTKQLSIARTVEATKKGQAAIAFSLKELWSDSQFVMVAAKLGVSGRITPVAAGAALPKKLRIQMRHLSASGTPKTTKTFDAVVSTDGTIASQSFSFSTMILVNYKESIELSAIPLDKNLPASTVELTVGLNSARPWEPVVMPEPPSGPAAKTGKIEYVYGGYPAALTKGQLVGRFTVSSGTTAGLELTGKLAVKGKITPDAGEPLPTKLRAQVKHLDAAGKLLRTDKFDVVVKSNGTISSQSFNLTTANATGIKETLEFGFMPLDRDLPDCELSATVTFTSTVN